MAKLVVAMPQFHGPAVAALDGRGQGLLVALGGELLDAVDMAAAPVEEIETVILH